MNILMIARGYPTPKEPQWGCFEQDQAEALQRYGHRVVVVSVDSRFLWRKRKIGTTIYNKNGVIYYNLFWIPGAIVSLLGGRRLSLYIRQLQLLRLYKMIVAKYDKPDIVYGHFFANTAMGVVLKQKFGIPLVGIEHAGRFNDDKLDKHTKSISKYAYDNTDAIIAVSDSLKQRLYYHFHKDSFVVHNLVASIFESKKTDVLKKQKAFHFVSTGSLLYGKGFDLLIEAFRRSRLWKKEARLIIIGEGLERNNLQNIIDEAGLTKQISLVGRKTKVEIADILCVSHAFVLASRSENFSVAVLEALSVGLPVIATICGGIKECINERNGLLVPVENVDALTKALVEMYENYSRYDTDYIVSDYQNRFSSAVIAHQLTEIFEGVIRKKGEIN